MSPTQNLVLDAPPHLASDQPPSSGGQTRRPPPPNPAGGRRNRPWWLPGCCPAPCSAWGLWAHCCWGCCCSAAFQILVLRRPLRSLLARDTAGFARGWVGKVSVAVILIAIPAAMVLSSVAGGRYGRYADDSWKALLMLVRPGRDLPRLAATRC